MDATPQADVLQAVLPHQGEPTAQATAMRELVATRQRCREQRDVSSLTVASQRLAASLCPAPAVFLRVQQQRKQKYRSPVDTGAIRARGEPC